MTPELHVKAKQRFLEACDLDGPARREYLDQHCANDPDLLAEVESLLQYHVTDTLIAPPAAPCSPDMNHGGERWLPGSTVAGRYRIVYRIGKGGMGEVYRAEDTVLSRPVALKFITAGRGTDPVWLSLFHAEARTASTITHRHVCRIYDIGETDGEAFISMEYIDGENLATLLGRVGRLTGEKAGQLARQLCLGLAAIHDAGVLHRDLKPANVIIDPRGEARITDFGIAVGMEAALNRGIRAGTPPYMAPEVIRGEPATVRSDLYALGLILYELVTGRCAFAAGDGPQAPASLLSPPSEWAPDLDSGFEQTILRCLEADPSHRPGSAFEVLAGLPGGEVLNAIMAAGEVPPVEVVAATASGSRWDRLLSHVGAVVTIAGLLAVLMLAPLTMLLSYADLAQPPDVLADRARQILQKAGYKPERYRVEQGFIIHLGRWERIRRTPAASASADGPLPQRFPSGQEIIGYHYALLDPSSTDQLEPGFISLQAPIAPVAQAVVDGHGRLLELGGPASSSPPAGSQPAEPTAERPTGSREHSTRLVLTTLFLSTLLLTAPMAWQNLRRRRSDRRGALRIAVLVFVMQIVLHSVKQAPPASVTEGFSWFISGMQVGLFTAFLVWLYYVALEPNVRRFWPQSLISWARVLGGEYRDALVGRDVLIGCAFGVVTILIMQLTAWVKLGSSQPYAGLVAPILDWELGRLCGYGFTLSALAGSGAHAIVRALLALALMLLFRLATGRRWAAALLFATAMTVAYAVALCPLVGVGYIQCGLLALLATLILDRIGFLAFVVGLFVSRLLLITPLTLHLSSWFAGQSLLSAAVVAGLALAGLYASRSRPRRLLGWPV